ncbi:hypothetical protein NQ036_06850 [Brevibacterium sp. 91QC2O2]|uniref:hypothetical protein n=1 Tax=Brevibacterium sp. 91QC2O2 TaxID=2968458 RepID=UPI00211C3EE3|nr:hypothetical protein [Brevibacterium sp. 91QC2O2]MCQ9367962.1 hypothetical protein [Brevibacterium sp. 91QC2O2]
MDSYRQRKSDSDWRTLPDKVERRRTPNWPLNPPPTDRERTVWRRLWRQGQSIVWEEQHQAHAVAIYVRMAVVTEEDPRAVPISLLTECRRREDALGLSMDGLLRHKWRFAPPPPEMPVDPKNLEDDEPIRTADRLAAFLSQSDDTEA